MIYPYSTHSLLTAVASDDNPPPPLNPQSSKASKPINKPVVPLPTVEEEGKGEKDIIIVNKGIKKRSVPLGVMPGKRKRPKLLILTDELPDWVVDDCQHHCTAQQI